MIFQSIYHSPLGTITLESDGTALTALRLLGQGDRFNSNNITIVSLHELEIFHHTKNWLDDYFHDKIPDSTKLILAPQGNEFRQKIWKLLLEIPYGQTTTYGNIAKQMAIYLNKEKMSAQAVGNAVGNNPISIIIPCHRVVGTSGNLTGYAGGMDLKVKLLTIEHLDFSRFTFPKKKGDNHGTKKKM